MGKIRVVIIEADTDDTNADQLFAAIGGAIGGNRGSVVEASPKKTRGPYGPRKLKISKPKQTDEE